MIFQETLEKKLHLPSVSVQVHDLLDSTNAEAKRQVTAFASQNKFDPVLLVAREQSAGRGRLGRSFLSRAGQGIFMSLLYFTEKDLSEAVSVTTAAAAVTAKAIEAVTKEPMRIKWVNDIYNDRGKVCGILAETMAVGALHAVIVGIGINVGEESFPPELQGIASSVGHIEGREEELIARIVCALLSHAADPADRSYMQDYRERFLLEGMRVDLLRAGALADRGQVLGVTDDGGLILYSEISGEKVTVHSGEVSVRKTK